MSPAKRPGTGGTTGTTGGTTARYLTVRMVADELGISVHTVYRMIHEGILPGVRVGSVLRVPRALLEEYLEENRIGAC
jgi:excisionase family DNA binding protein